MLGEDLVGVYRGILQSSLLQLTIAVKIFYELLLMND